jgi:hypothetical protein
VNRKSKHTSQRLALFQSGGTVLCSCLRANQLKMFRPQRNPRENGRVCARSRLHPFEMAGSARTRARSHRGSISPLRPNPSAGPPGDTDSDGLLFAGGRQRALDARSATSGTSAILRFSAPRELDSYQAQQWSIYVGNVVSRWRRVTSAQTVVFSRRIRVEGKDCWRPQSQSTIRVSGARGVRTSPMHCNDFLGNLI